MICKVKYILFGFLTIILLNSCNSQKNIKVNNLRFPEKNSLPKDFLNHLNKQKKYFRFIYEQDTTIVKKYSDSFILKKINNSKEPKYIYIARYLFLYNYKEMIPELIKRITNNKKIGLENSSGILILERPEYGSYSGYHADLLSSDDLFKVSGRANFLLKEITGKDFGNVNIKSTKEELQEIQKKWIKWLRGL